MTDEHNKLNFNDLTYRNEEEEEEEEGKVCDELTRA